MTSRCAVVANGLLAFVLCAVGCRTEPAGTGERCSRNSECGAPLVCRLDRCRRECNTTRDCTPGLTCLLDAAGLGACQLPAEKSCALESDCASPLVCRFAQCVNVCEEDIDCPAGSRCAADPNGRRACIDMSGKPCVHHDECAATGQTCALDGRCRDECVNHRDCRFGTMCCEADLACHTELECAMVMPRDMGPPDRPDSGAPDGSVPPPPPPPSLGITSVSCGGDVTCGVVPGAVSPGGRTPSRVYCWGRNDRGQLGRGTMTPMEIEPAPVSFEFDEPFPETAAVRCSEEACCTFRRASLDLQQMVCWGRVADPDTGMPMDTPSPVLIPQLSAQPLIYGVSLQSEAFCGDASDFSAVHSIYCWGDNTYGQLGDGTTTTPRGIVAMPDLYAAQVGAGFTCAPRGEPAVPVALDCWGRNDRGQLGRDMVSPMEPTPGAAVTSGHFGTPLGGVTLGRAHACALDGLGSIVCWGAGTEGQIGDGAGVDRLHGVSPGIEANEVVCGGDMCCASAGGDSELYCWGTGPLGSPGMTTSNVPVAVTRPPSGEPLSIACVGRAHACAQTETGVYCWGDNSFGQLGTGAMDASEVPVPTY